MNTVNIRLPRQHKSVEIHTFSDWHVGDKACDITAIREQVSTIQATPNAYIICNGDLMNNATKTSVSDIYSEALSPMEQLQEVCSLLNPVRDRVLMLTQGNHEARTYRTDGIDLTALLAKELGLYDRYTKEGGVIFLRVGEDNRHAKGRQVCYTIYCTHGSGGGRKEGAKAIRLADMASIVDTDIYVHSHTHLPMIMKQNFYRIDTCNSAVAEITKLFVNTSAQLKYGGYGQTYEFKPSNTTSPVIYLNGTKKEFAARL